MLVVVAAAQTPYMGLLAATHTIIALVLQAANELACMTSACSYNKRFSLVLDQIVTEHN